MSCGSVSHEPASLDPSRLTFDWESPPPPVQRAQLPARSSCSGCLDQLRPSPKTWQKTLDNRRKSYLTPHYSFRHGGATRTCGGLIQRYGNPATPTHILNQALGAW